MNNPSLARLVLEFPVVALLLGLVIWLFGWRISKFFVLVAGVFIGANLALRFSYLQMLQSIPEVVLMVLGGVIGGVLAFTALYIMFFFIGVTIGFEIMAAYVQQHIEVLGLLFGVALGMAFVILYNIAIVVATSFVGATLMLDATILITSISLNPLLYAVALVVLTAVGIGLQYKLWGSPQENSTTVGEAT